MYGQRTNEGTDPAGRRQVGKALSYMLSFFLSQKSGDGINPQFGLLHFRTRIQTPANWHLQGASCPGFHYS